MNPKSLFSRFNNYVSAEGRMNITDSIDFMRTHFNSRSIGRILLSCAKSLDDMPCDSSYEHNNGFLKISLLKTDFIHARLHIWHRQEKSTIHNHGWDFVSYGLYGRIQFTNFQEDDADGIEVDKTVLREIRDQKDNQLVRKENIRIGRKSIAPVSVYFLEPDSYHAIDYRVPHQSHLLTTRAASLIISGPSVANESAIFKKPGETNPRNEYKTLGTAEKRDAIISVVSHLSANMM